MTETNLQQSATPRIVISTPIAAILVLFLVVLLGGCDGGDGDKKTIDCYAALQACQAQCDAALNDAENAWRSCKEASKDQLAIDLQACEELEGEAKRTCITQAYADDAARKVACGEELADAVAAHRSCREACGAEYNACVGN